MGDDTSRQKTHALAMGAGAVVGVVMLRADGALCTPRFAGEVAHAIPSGMCALDHSRRLVQPTVMPERTQR